eukprot:15042611-Alexandrium_andersonii.AAC.1
MSNLLHPRVGDRTVQFVGASRPPGALLIVAIGPRAQNGSERTPRELWGPVLRSFLGPCKGASLRFRWTYY